MLSHFLAVAALLASAQAAPRPQTDPSKTYQIRGVTPPVFHLYLQPSSDGAPILGPESSAADFLISSTISTADSSLFLNIGESVYSYKPLHFNSTATTTGWGLEGDTIVTTNGSPWGRQLNFLACERGVAGEGEYELYLQTGREVPGGSCTSQTLHLPCLC